MALKCTPQRAQSQVAPKAAAAPFYQEDPALNVEQNLTASFTKLTELLKSPPCVLDADYIDNFPLREAMKEVLQYHSAQLAKTDFPADRFAFWRNAWLNLYQQSPTEYLDKTGRNILFDLDEDGVLDTDDSFPTNVRHHIDNDGDGVPDEIDQFPEDASRFISAETCHDFCSIEDGKFVLNTKIFVKAADDLPLETFHSTLKDWQKKINPYLAEHLSKNDNIKWDITLAEDTTGKSPFTVTVPQNKPASWEKLSIEATRSVWPYTVSVSTVAHESGHHIGFPDGYHYNVKTVGFGESLHTWLMKEIFDNTDDIMGTTHYSGQREVIYADDVKLALAEQIKAFTELDEIAKLCTTDLSAMQQFLNWEKTSAFKGNYPTALAEKIHLIKNQWRNTWFQHFQKTVAQTPENLASTVALGNELEDFYKTAQQMPDVFDVKFREIYYLREKLLASVEPFLPELKAEHSCVAVEKIMFREGHISLKDPLAKVAYVQFNKICNVASQAVFPRPFWKNFSTLSWVSSVPELQTLLQETPSAQIKTRVSKDFEWVRPVVHLLGHFAPTENIVASPELEIGVVTYDEKENDGFEYLVSAPVNPRAQIHYALFPQPDLTLTIGAGAQFDSFDISNVTPFLQGGAAVALQHWNFGIRVSVNYGLDAQNTFPAADLFAGWIF